MLRYVLIFLFFSPIYPGAAQESLPVKAEAIALTNLILKNHFGPKKINDDFSRMVFEEAIKSIDPDRLYFTQQDIIELSAYKHKIDDDLTGPTWVFLPALTQRYKQ